MEDVPSRDVYLPPGFWVDYQSGKTYEGAGWQYIVAGDIPLVMLVKDGAAIPHIELAQSTAEMNWREIVLMVFSAETSVAEGYFCLPEEGALHALCLEREGNDFVLKDGPLQGKVKWGIRTPSDLAT
jgi:alpha-D-xyloside xylohydrolase